MYAPLIIPHGSHVKPVILSVPLQIYDKNANNLISSSFRNRRIIYQ